MYIRSIFIHVSTTTSSLPVGPPISSVSLLVQLYCYKLLPRTLVLARYMYFLPNFQSHKNYYIFFLIFTIQRNREAGCMSDFMFPEPCSVNSSIALPVSFILSYISRNLDINHVIYRHITYHVICGNHGHKSRDLYACAI